MVNVNPREVPEDNRELPRGVELLGEAEGQVARHDSADLLLGPAGEDLVEPRVGGVVQAQHSLLQNQVEYRFRGR